MEELERLRARAENWRRLASQISDAMAIEALTVLTARLDRQIARLEGKAKAHPIRPIE